MRLSNIGGLVLAGVCVAGSATLIASDFVGVYAVVESVAFEPNATAPERVQIRGAFAMSEGARGSAYGTAQRGYLYYSCPEGRQDICRREWADLQTVAGKNVGVGFGARFLQNGRVRKADETPASPDVYPIERGIVRLAADHESLPVIERIKAALRGR